MLYTLVLRKMPQKKIIEMNVSSILGEYLANFVNTSLFYLWWIEYSESQELIVLFIAI